MKNFITFYLVGAVIIGVMVGSMEKVSAEFRGKPVPYPRLVMGAVCGAIWPYTLFKLVTGL